MSVLSTILLVCLLVMEMKDKQLSMLKPLNSVFNWLLFYEEYIDRSQPSHFKEDHDCSRIDMMYPKGWGVDKIHITGNVFPLKIPKSNKALGDQEVGQRDSTLFISSVISLTLDAVNPNKVGIRYSRSRLHVFNQGLVIGMIRVPSFYQPAHSKNVSVQTRVLFQCVNASQILSRVPQQHDSIGTFAKTRILGDIRARVQVLQTTLPKFKVALDCEVDIDYNNLAFGNEVQSMISVTSLKAKVE
ncbi:hypothetical protein RJ639_008229 [Escallonia herrerae]|uniref:Late embryogenesis abundant protein LEA-2 subgroup domain-containing protein n=1 Tax=Escallonia herrerae TaxID=1293975 RepID=A0AA88VS08_9ASTE|nr:hypothetical protein RJ639_008229 [Escallonia herrerae]